VARDAGDLSVRLVTMEEHWREPSASRSKERSVPKLPRNARKASGCGWLQQHDKFARGKFSSA
jgi:hypothetical protein